MRKSRARTVKATSAILIGALWRAYHVFNAAQVDGYEVPATPQLAETERIERAEQFFGGLDADVREGGSRAFYSPSEDYIQMPPFAAFKRADFRYSVLAHKVTHWTGATTRLNRNLAPRFQKEEYAAEELIAELGSAFVCGELELSYRAATGSRALHPIVAKRVTK